MRHHTSLRLIWRPNSRFLPSKSERFCTNRTQSFSAYAARRADSRTLKTEASNYNSSKEDDLTPTFEDAVTQSKEKQIRTPWHRDGSSLPPVSRPRRAGAMVKGKLLTTPSRLMKLTLPLTTVDHNSDRKDIEPLALLVHPQQPLSYLERLIQSELPSIKTGNGNEKIPSVHFLAEDSTQDAMEAGKEGESGDNQDGLEESKIDGKVEKTGILKNASASQLRGGPGEGGVETYSGQTGWEAETAKSKRGFVRWSSSTDIGDFIRDAARGKEFAVEIEGAPNEIRVGVPSFSDRTHYLRQRLRRISDRISDMAAIKKECDDAAHRSAQRLAKGGFGVLVSWWILVYYFTFLTELGWDEMEPWTYLVGLSGIMGGYLYFIYHNREISYRSALNITINRRLMKLYEVKGFNLQKWEGLVSEGNELRREIKAVATEYDVEWNESEDTDDQRVVEALKKDREKTKEQKNDKEDSESTEKNS